MLYALAEDLLQRPGAALPDLPQGVARAAVAAVLRPQGDLLFIRRSERDGDPWSGHMAFPGGRMEAADRSTRAAAERETHEELGLPLWEHGRLLGPLDEQSSPVRRGPPTLVISPFVYALERDEVVLAPNYEVASVHWISLERLAAGEGRGVFPFQWNGHQLAMPRVDIDGVRIWGLTLRFLDDMLFRIGGTVSPPVQVMSS